MEAALFNLLPCLLCVVQPVRLSGLRPDRARQNGYMIDVDLGQRRVWRRIVQQGDKRLMHQIGHAWSVPSVKVT